MFGVNKIQNEKKRINNFIAGIRKNAQSGGYVTPGNTQQGQISNTNKGNENNDNLFIQNGNRETSNDNKEILPLDIGYGAPGGQVLGSYN